MDSGRIRPSDPLGINRISKGIRKSPLHQPTFANPKQPQQQQQQVYNINKNDFRSVVQQLTGTPTRDPFPFGNPPAPAHQPPKPPSTRLHRIRPPPLTPIAPPLQQPHPVILNPNFYPPAPAQPPPAVPFSPRLPPTPPPGSATLESPISAYMRYLGGSFLPHPSQPMDLRLRPPCSTDMLPHPRVAAPFPSPRPPGLPTSPASQFVQPSPSGFLNLLSPRSPFPLFSPAITANFALSPMGGQSGILGLGPHPPSSPGLLFPPSPSGPVPIVSPWWKDL